MAHSKLGDFTINYMDHLHNTINRMSASSRSMKQISFALFSGVLAYTGAIKSAPSLLFVIPFIMLWYMNAFYLKTQNNIREQYKRTKYILIKVLNGDAESEKDLINNLYVFPSRQEPDYKQTHTVSHYIFNPSVCGIYSIQILIIIYLSKFWIPLKIMLGPIRIICE